MKKGYKKCPFCANEIKEKAIKCQYCWEFLTEKEKIQCPFCLNEIDDDVKKCPFCDEILDYEEKKETVKKGDKKTKEKNVGNPYPLEKRVWRKEFWNRFAKAVGLIFVRVFVIVLIATVWEYLGFNKDAFIKLWAWVIAIYFWYLYLYKYLLLKIKRLHDLWLSWWWVIVTYIPFINIITFILLASLKSKD